MAWRDKNTVMATDKLNIEVTIKTNVEELKNTFMEPNFVHLYNPENARNLTEDQIKAMQEFTLDQVKQLALAYPNQGHTNAYLIMKNKNAKDQIYPSGTWQNLYNLWTKNGRKEFVAYTFKVLFINRKATTIGIPAKIQDLTDKDIAEAPGLRKTFKEVQDIGKGVEPKMTYLNALVEGKVENRVKPVAGSNPKKFIVNPPEGEALIDPENETAGIDTDPDNFPDLTAEAQKPRKPGRGRPPKAKV